MGDKPTITLATVLGCERVAAKFRDGTQADVIVYHVPITDVPEWLELDSRGIAGEAEKVRKLYARQPEGWLETLLPESYEAILAKGEELNRPNCDRARSRAAKLEAEWVALGRERMKLAAELGLNLSAMQSPALAPPTA